MLYFFGIAFENLSNIYTIALRNLELHNKKYKEGA